MIILPSYFLRTPLHGLAYHTSSFSQCLFPLYLSHILNRFQYNLYCYLPYACSTGTTMFRHILSFKVIPEHTLHSRVEDLMAHSSTVICLREDCYINVNCESVILCKTIILVISYARFFKVCFNGLDLFILLMHILILKQVHVIHTYISCCFILEVRDLCIPLALTMLPLQTSDMPRHTIFIT